MGKFELGHLSSKLKCGDKNTGIFSLNPEKFTDDDFTAIVHETIVMPIMDMDKSHIIEEKENLSNQKQINEIKTQVSDPPRTLTPLDSESISGPSRLRAAIKQVCKQFLCELAHIPLKTPSIDKRKQHSEIMRSTTMKSLFESANKKKKENAVKKNSKVENKGKKRKSKKKKKDTKPKKNRKKKISRLNQVQMNLWKVLNLMTIKWTI
ncbi:hypothetical protein FQA39_LY06474 [Lamprigera yunnana]|nr:hypothetical protein FQA39_LY06474 [Lamprigera yunnana]